MKKLDLIGKVFGRLKVIEQKESKHGKTQWLCKCSCGNEKIIEGTSLTRGYTKSCGCLLSEISSKNTRTHGMKGTRIYSIWNGIKTRTSNPNRKSNKYYLDKNITCCNKWKRFEGFYEDMKDSYFDGAFIDRINNNKGYYKENCRWVTIKESNRNKTNLIYIKHNGKIKIASDWSKELNINYQTILYRYKHNKNIETGIEMEEI